MTFRTLFSAPRWGMLARLGITAWVFSVATLAYAIPGTGTTTSLATPSASANAAPVSTDSAFTGTFQNPTIARSYARTIREVSEAIALSTGSLTPEDRKFIDGEMGRISRSYLVIDRAIALKQTTIIRRAARAVQLGQTRITARLRTAALRIDANTTTGTITSSGASISQAPVVTQPQIDPNTFADLGIKLDAGIPTIVERGFTVHVSGTVTQNDKTDTLFFLKTPSGKEIALSRKNPTDARFVYDYPLEEVGDYLLVVAAGQSFKTRTAASISAVAQTPITVSSSHTLGSASRIVVNREEFGDLSAVHTLTFPGVTGSNTYVIRFSSGSTRVTYSGSGSIAIPAGALSVFGGTGSPILTEVFARNNASSGSYESVFARVLSLVPSYRGEINEPITATTTATGILVQGTIKSSASIKPDILVIAPNGSVGSYTFPASQVSGGFLSSGIASGFVPLLGTGVYLVEVNYRTGFAAIDVPVLFGDDLLPLGTSVFDDWQKRDDNTLSTVESASLDFLNTLRRSQGKSQLKVDPTASRLAQAKAQDMADNRYIGHTDSQGVYIDGTAKRLGINITTSLSENVAGGNVTSGVLISSLSLSPGHRRNMLISGWNGVGIGFVRRDGVSYYVQVFVE